MTELVVDNGHDSYTFVLQEFEQLKEAQKAQLQELRMESNTRIEKLQQQIQTLQDANASLSLKSIDVDDLILSQEIQLGGIGIHDD